MKKILKQKNKLEKQSRKLGAYILDNPKFKDKSEAERNLIERYYESVNRQLQLISYFEKVNQEKETKARIDIAVKTLQNTVCEYVFALNKVIEMQK